MRAIFVFFFCACISAANSAIFFNLQPEIPGHEGECYDSDKKTFYKEYSIMKNEGNECVQKLCGGKHSEPGKVCFQTYTCPVVTAGPGCTVVEAAGKPYPDCCPKVVRDSCGITERKQN